MKTKFFFPFSLGPKGVVEHKILKTGAGAGACNGDGL